MFARGDRRLGKVLEQAFEHGCKFDGWSDFFLPKWLEVFEECGIDPTFYNQRRRSFDEILPWDHIDYGIKNRFKKENVKRPIKMLPLQTVKKLVLPAAQLVLKEDLC